MPSTNIAAIENEKDYITGLYMNALKHLKTPTVISTVAVAEGMHRPALEVHQTLSSLRQQLVDQGCDIKWTLSSEGRVKSRRSSVYLDDTEYIQKLFVNAVINMTQPTAIRAIAVSEAINVSAIEAYRNLIRTRHSLISQGCNIMWTVSAEDCGQGIDEQRDNYGPTPEFSDDEDGDNFVYAETAVEYDNENEDGDAEEEDSSEDKPDSGNGTDEESPDELSSSSSSSSSSDESPPSDPVLASSAGTKRKAQANTSQDARKKPRRRPAKARASAPVGPPPAHLVLPPDTDECEYRFRTDSHFHCRLCTGPDPTTGNRPVFDRPSAGSSGKKPSVEKHVKQEHPELAKKWEKYCEPGQHTWRIFKRQKKN